MLFIKVRKFHYNPPSMNPIDVSRYFEHLVKYEVACVESADIEYYPAT
jgi:hypothetical protein